MAVHAAEPASSIVRGSAAPGERRAPRLRSERLSPTDLAVAAVLILVATLVRWWLDPMIGSRLPFLFYIAALVPIAWFCSRWTYIAAAFAGLLLGDWFFLPPRGSLFHASEIDQVEMLAYVLVASALGAFAWSSRVARARAEAARDAAAAAADAVKASEARVGAHAAELAALMDAVPAMVFIAGDAECRKITANSAGLRFFRAEGCDNLSHTASPGACPGPWQEFRDGRRLAPNELPVQIAARGTPVRDFEMDIAFETGETKTMFGHAVPLRDDRGRPRGAIAAFIDTTEIKRARQALEQSEAKFRSMFDSTLAGMNVLHVDGRVLEANDAYLKMIGRTREELEEGKVRWDEATAPEYREQHHAAMRRALAEGRTAPFEKELIRPDGARVPAMFMGARMTGHDDRVLGIVLDVSARFHIEEALRLSEERFRMLADAAPVMIGIVDAAGSAEYVNRRFCDFTGLSRGQCEGRGWASAVHAGEAAELLRAWERAGSAGAPMIFECRCRRADGVYHWVTGSAVPIRDSAGAVTRWVASATDIDELKRAQEELAARSAELGRKAGELARSNADLDDFAHIAAHDLKEPLRGIRHNIAFFLEDSAERLDPQARERLANVEALAARMHELLIALMVYAEMSRGELRRTQEDSGRLVADAVGLLRPHLARAGAEVMFETPLPQVACDRQQAVQVFAHLISNGVKFNRSHKKQVRVGAIGRPGETVVFYVRDNGIGIKPEHFQSIFRIFRRLHSRDEYGGGSGAGLAMVKRIVERHGGRIWLESEPDAGTTFYFTLGQEAARAEPPLIQTLPVEIREPAENA